MHRVWFLFIIFCLQSLFVEAHQDSVVSRIDSFAAEAEDLRPKYEYWKKNYYNDIKRIDSLSRPDQQSFSEMFGKYQSKEYEYVESISDKLSVWQSIKNWISKYLEDLFPDINANPADWFYDLLGVIGAVLVVFLLYKFFFSGKQFIINTKEELGDDQATLEFVEKNLLEIDISTYIKESINANNYSLAVRYQQLLNIQLLAKKNFISWDQRKTNMELMEEIEDVELRSDFKKCTSLFDYAWFGGFEISTSKFLEITKQFDEFQRRWS